MAANKKVIFIIEGINVFLATKLYLINFWVCWAGSQSSKTQLIRTSSQSKDGFLCYAHANLITFHCGLCYYSKVIHLTPSDVKLKTNWWYVCCKSRTNCLQYNACQMLIPVLFLYSIVLKCIWVWFPTELNCCLHLFFSPCSNYYALFTLTT